MNNIDNSPQNSFRISYKYFLIFLCTAFVSIIVTIVQVMISHGYRNIIYLIACYLYGPLHFIAALLALSINFITNAQKKSRLAIWSLRIIAIGIIPFLIIVSLNGMFIFDCVKHNNYKHCKDFKVNLVILLLCVFCLILDSFFSILYDFD